MDKQKLLNELTAEEKVALLGGTDFMYTNPVPRLSVPSAKMSDGPHGLRVQREGGDNGVQASEPATAFPTAATLACGWNEDNAFKMGEAIGEECSYYGVNLLLGPGANIKRNPRCGRNFEYFSEEPHLSGKLAAAEIRGVQKNGVGAVVKHFALNNAEDYRFMGDSVADMRAVREIYLKSFEIAIKEGKPAAVMCAYNKINGVHCSENKWLLSDVLRGEWGFSGAVMTDWGAARDRVAGVKAGLDLEMPGDSKYCRASVYNAVKSGELDESELNAAALNVLGLAELCERAQPSDDAHFSTHHALVAEIAADCAVLLKNDGTLPLNKNKRLFVAGDLFEKMRYQGAGSSMINPAMLTSPKQAFDARGVDYAFSRGYKESGEEAEKDACDLAVREAEGCDTAIVFAGLTDYVESEGGDRKDICLPQNQLALIDALIEAGKKVVVVLFGGAVAELPFKDKVAAILYMALPGQNGGTAVAELLFGDKNPCGKLAETWVERYGDVPFGDEFSSRPTEVYKESVFVGYRYYLTAGKGVAFPFGYGLSYTTFGYSDMLVERRGGKLAVSCTVTNTGDRFGGEVVQLYVSAPKSGVFKPLRGLKAFKKVYLSAGESVRVEVAVDVSELSYYDIAEARRRTEEGEYEFQLCSDCATVRLSKPIKIEGERVQSPYPEEVQKVYSCADMAGVTDNLFEKMSGMTLPPEAPKKPLTVESRFTDFRYAAMGKLLYSIVMRVLESKRKKAERLPEGAARDNAVKGAAFLRAIIESCSFRSMSMSSGGRLPYNVAEGVVAFANGRFFKAIKKLCSRIRAPRLPKQGKKRKG